MATTIVINTVTNRRIHMRLVPTRSLVPDEIIEGTIRELRVEFIIKTCKKATQRQRKQTFRGNHILFPRISTLLSMTPISSQNSNGDQYRGQVPSYQSTHTFGFYPKSQNPPEVMQNKTVEWKKRNKRNGQLPVNLMSEVCINLNHTIRAP